SRNAESSMAPAMSTALGHFSWAELNTTNWQSAWSFYEKLFGWKQSRVMDMGEGKGDYAMFGQDTNEKNAFGGMSNMAAMMKAPPHWLYYIVVDNCDAAAKKVTKLGGKIMNGPMDIPGGRIAQCIDPQGAVFGIHS